MSVLGVIPTWMAQPGDLDVTISCLESIVTTAPDLDVLVVDDGSPVQSLVAELEATTSRLGFDLERKENTGFAKTVNVGLRQAIATDRDAVLINADIDFFEDGWLDKMVAQRRQDDTGPAEVVGALLLYPNGLIQHGGTFFSLLHRCFEHRFRYAPGDLPEAQFAERCPVTGALQFIRHKNLIEVGIYDENFLLGWEDVDYCVRTFQAGGDCVYQPRVRAYHHESLFRGRPNERVADWQNKSWIYLMEKYKETSFAEWVPTVV